MVARTGVAATRTARLGGKGYLKGGADFWKHFGGADGGAIAFDSWNKPVILTAPSGALDFSKLGSGG